MASATLASSSHAHATPRAHASPPVGIAWRARVRTHQRGTQHVENVRQRSVAFSVRRWCCGERADCGHEQRDGRVADLHAKLGSVVVMSESVAGRARTRSERA